MHFVEIAGGTDATLYGSMKAVVGRFIVIAQAIGSSTERVIVNVLTTFRKTRKYVEAQGTKLIKAAVYVWAWFEGALSQLQYVAVGWDGFPAQQF